jgi:ABC-type long-subunit fatty acid transport system fused permease/ATPase subunit
MNKYSNIPWYKRFFLVSFAWALIAFGYWYFHVPNLQSTEQDEKEMADKLQKERAQLNKEIGYRSFDRLKEKYGDE